MKKIFLALTLLTLVGCSQGQSALDKCYDAQDGLWSPYAVGDNYIGNEAYWDAISDCIDKY